MTSPIEDDWICLVEAGEPHLSEIYLNAAVDVALERALEDGRLGILRSNVCAAAGAGSHPAVRCVRMRHGSALRADSDSWSSRVPYVRHT